MVHLIGPSRPPRTREKERQEILFTSAPPQSGSWHRTACRPSPPRASKPEGPGPRPGCSVATCPCRTRACATQWKGGLCEHPRRALGCVMARTNQNQPETARPSAGSLRCSPGVHRVESLPHGRVEHLRLLLLLHLLRSLLSSHGPGQAPRVVPRGSAHSALTK